MIHITCAGCLNKFEINQTQFYRKKRWCGSTDCKEVIDDKKYYLYQYDTHGKLTEIKCFNKIKSGKLITHQKFTYNLDGTLHEETVQEYYENDKDTKFIDSSYLYAYSGNLLRMITFKSFGKISEYLIYNYNP